MTQKIFVTSDWHFDHSGMIKGISKWTEAIPPRQFDSVEHMNDTIIDRINERVQRQDILWCLGDIIFSNVNNLAGFMARIKCNNVNLIYGNHDSALRRNGAAKSLFQNNKDYHTLKYQGVKIRLFHYPITSWNGLGRGHIHLFGHCHGNLPDVGGRRMDVGVDTNDFYPYLLDDVVEEMLARPILYPGDHHVATSVQIDTFPPVPKD